MVNQHPGWLRQAPGTRRRPTERVAKVGLDAGDRERDYARKPSPRYHQPRAGALIVAEAGRHGRPAQGAAADAGLRQAHAADEAPFEGWSSTSAKASMALDSRRAALAAVEPGRWS